MIVSFKNKNGITANFHFDNEEHKKWWQELLWDLTAEGKYEEHPKEMDAALKYGKEGKLNLE